MPDVKDILKNYNLQGGEYIGSCRILSSTGTHNTVVRYHDYTYTLKLILECPNHENVVSYLNTRTQVPKIIYSHYGNPYLCTINPWTLTSESDGRLIVQANAHSRRQ